ncbi:thioredoxin family protein [Subdoligranulum variabile]|uniref:Redox-active disulfide protein 2 n=1 Tax=Subdoligranulum variabile DSM 15176 TaxID=411471 RepID=D1PI40_9FIRM|nr:thioredoxin family protein [Subdoligranulum variabile]EFB77640.1 redox-active disulfide protein 2 [Subdoligranulum variabile DSM 15176]UWP69277.1 thioredoxin family protein [Subdoligranulum variabile]
MKLFGKKESVQTETGNEDVKVLGGGCANCRALEASAKAALAELGLPQEVGHITDFSQIAACGVLHTPALMVDGKVVASGRVLSKEEAKALIEKARNQA